MKTIRELIDEGVISMDTKVNGRLPIGADCIIGLDAQVYFPATNGTVGGPQSPITWKNMFLHISKCYSSREAAAASRKEGV